MRNLLCDTSLSAFEQRGSIKLVGLFYLGTSYRGIMAKAQLRLSDIVSAFDGSSDFDEWVNKVELVAELQNVKKLETFVPLFLSGPAYSVYDGLESSTKQDYSLLRNALSKAFSLSAFSAYESFVARRYVPGEAPDVYLSDLRRLGKLVSPIVDEAWLKCAFVSGLPREVKVQLKASSAADDLSLSETLERTRTIISVCKTEIGCAARTVSGGSGESRLPAKPCSFCDGSDHRVRYCPEKLKTMTCFECRQKGHLRATCPSLTKNE